MMHKPPAKGRTLGGESLLQGAFRCRLGNHMVGAFGFQMPGPSESLGHNHF